MKKRSPLKRKPLRNPGQSLEERVQDVLTDRLLLPLIGALFLCAVAVLDWWRLFTSADPQPVVATVLAGLAIAFVARRFIAVRRELKSLRLGIDGEKAVAQYLEAHR